MVVSCRWVAVAAVLGGALGACGSDDSGDDDDMGMAGSGASGSTAGSASPSYGTDLDSAILFSPMYTAYDGEHTFSVPAVVNGYSGVVWEAEDPSMVDLVQEGDAVMITSRKAGTTRIIARAGDLSGSAEINITEADPSLWAIGETRYNNEIPLPNFDPSMVMGMGFTIPDDLSCRNCHGSGAEALSVEHTPQQTGGYSDEQLIAIFTMGQKPPTAGWKSGIPEAIYTRLHTWEATEEEKQGIVVYLRSLTPASQGDIDFGGLFHRGM
jgi:hypothetical protein